MGAVFPARARLDWHRIESWTREIVADDLSAIETIFVAHTARPPRVIWSPDAEQLTAVPVRVVRTYWTDLAADGSLPHQSRIDALDMRLALGFVMLIDVVDNGRDFRYRLFGSTVARVSGIDLTGRLVSSHPASAYVTEFAIATYRAALQRREPIYTERTPALAERTTRWQRLACPLVDDSGAVTRLLTASAPVARDGRIITS